MASVALLAGSTPAAAASIYDPATQSSLRNLVSAMESYAMFDGGSQYKGVTADALRSWGWIRPANVNVHITVERTGTSWRAVAQDVRPGSTEYTFTSAASVNGASPGTVRASTPQPVTPPAAATLTVTDVGDGIDVDGLTTALLAAGITLDEVCNYSIGVQTTNSTPSSPDDDTELCLITRAVPGVSMRTLLSKLASTLPGRVLLAAVALQFVGDGSTPATVPTWPQSADPSNPKPPKPRSTPASLPEGIWRITDHARRLGAANQVDPATAAAATEQCLKLVANAFLGVDPYDKCRSTPIFLSGQADVKEATDHDLEALITHPEWVQLNYKNRGGANSTWKNSKDTCQQQILGTQCDEFPFWSTSQGGPVTPEPSLKRILADHNTMQGSKLSTFYGFCAIEEGDEFLSIPVPPTAPTVTTLALCNR